MPFIVAMLFFLIAGLSFIAYSGTPHGGPTVQCGPVHLLGHNFTFNADCRYVSVAELALAICCTMLALIAGLTALRKRRRPIEYD
jgi:hypothetical protein